MHFSYPTLFFRVISPPPALLVFLLRLNTEGVGCFYAVHWSESLVSFLANWQIVIRVSLRHTWFLSLWAGCKPAKEWGALSPSQGFHNPLQDGTKICSLVRRKMRKCFMNALPLLSAFSMSGLMHKGLGWTWTHQPRKRQETWHIKRGASGHFLETWQQERTEVAAQYGQMFFPLTPCRVHIRWMIYSLYSEPKEKFKHCWLRSDFVWPLK